MEGINHYKGIGGKLMKVTCLLGSPRPEGNSAVLAKQFCNVAEKMGASVQTFVLNKLNYKGCQGCMACKTKTDKCVVQDDLTAVLEAVREGDVLVIATPIYMADVTSTIRAFIERAYSYFVPDFGTNPKPSRLSPGKQMVFIQTQGQPNEKLFADMFPRMDGLFKRLGFPNNHFIRACGVRKLGEVASHPEVMKQAEETARKVMNAAAPQK
jgi:multimeric flavodoxin WrbA